MSNHTPVLLQEILEYLQLTTDQIVVDATLDGGGHAKAIADACPGIKILGIEWDPSLARTFFTRHPELSGIVEVINDSYESLGKICDDKSVSPDRILFDLGLSSLHYEESGRGFSFLRDEPLDMRFNPETTAETAGHILNNATREELTKILSDFGEEQFAGQIAAAVAIARRTAPLRTTRELADLINSAVPEWYRHRKIHPATKTFQALRIAVNHELENISKGIDAALSALKSGGRILVVSFHGLEDKIVREKFKEAVKNKIAQWVTRQTIRPTWEEIKKNPRSRSAKLKIIEKL